MLIFQACPDVKDSIKWSLANSLEYNSMLCSMTTFREYCAFGLRKVLLLKDPTGILQIGNRNDMWHKGRLASVNHLPAGKILIVYLK